jgi:hypothetical protein
MQTVYILIVLLGLLLAALFGGDGIHAQAQYRVYLPMVETSVEFSSTPPVIVPTATAERGPL